VFRSAVRLWGGIGIQSFALASSMFRVDCSELLSVIGVLQDRFEIAHLYLEGRLQMKKNLSCLLALIISLNVYSTEKGSAALFVCTGDTKEYIDNRSPITQATSINLTISPKSGHTQIDKSWGCRGSDDLCKKFIMSQQKDKFFCEKSESDSDFSSRVSIVFYGASAKLNTEFVRNVKAAPRRAKKGPSVDWKTQKITSDLKCKGVNAF
jgi:hypothetical protein